jgi:Fis family transcriptional regulator
MSSPLSLHDFIRREVKKMIIGIGPKGQGNIYPLVMEEVEKTIIELVLQETDYNYFATAKVLGISRSTLYRRVEALKITH